MFATKLYAQLALTNKMWPKFCSRELEADVSELSWNLLTGHCWLGILARYKVELKR